MKYKVCSKCKIRKSILEFHKCKNSVQSRCRKCRNNKTIEKRKKEVERVSIYYKNLNKIQKQELRKYKRDYAKRKRNEMSFYDKENQRKKRRVEFMSINDIKNRRKKYRDYVNFKYGTDINYKIKRVLQSRIYKVLKKQIKSDSTIKLLGCSIEFFKMYLENKFLSGMFWDNYGKWHIDHIKPCASFDLSYPEEQKLCFYYKNLQPLWAKDNIIKSGKVKELVYE